MKRLWVLRGMVAIALAGAAGLTSHDADAQPISAETRTAARALFDDGRRLMGTGDYVNACPKLEESQRLDPGMGTQFNLADCQEHVGKLASAWTNFLEVANAAKTAGQAPREAAARSRAQMLAPKLSKLTVIATAQADGLEIKADGLPVNKGLWGTPVPVDPGDHKITASAPGKGSWSTIAKVKGDGASVTVSVPKLIDGSDSGLPDTPATPIATPASTAVPAPASSDQPSSSPPSSGSTQRTAAFVVGGVGIVGVALGAVFGLQAKSKYNDSLADCHPDNPNQCTSDGVSLRGSARTAGTISTIAIIAGGAAVVGGIALFVTLPKAGSAKATSGVGLSAGASMTQGGAGLSLKGGF